jgi:hypothetical protein
LRGLSSFIALAAALVIAVPALGQDDIYRPEPKPVPPVEKSAEPTNQPASKVDIAGRWIADASGSGVCNKGIIVEFSSNASGTTLFRNFAGTFTYRVRGTTVSFTTKYTDFFGNTASDIWTGTVSPEGNSITGSLEGSWGGCSFVMRR